MVTTAEELSQITGLPLAQLKRDFVAHDEFRVRVPRPFLKRVKQGDAQDPLLLQVMPQAVELDKVPGFGPDPLVEQAAEIPGLLHKYKSRVLLIVRPGCAVNCRYCFRRHFPYPEHQNNKARWQQALDYIARQSEVNEVIFSGGDPLMASDDQLDWLIGQIEGIPHVRRLRFHTRFPVMIPSRITDGLCQRLEHSRLKVVMVLHCNHANEIDDDLTQAMARLRQSKVHLLNQSVLLAGVNNTLEAQVDLSEALFAAGVLPYYLHLLDRVDGAAHFDVPEAQAQELVRSMLAELPGFLVPKLTREEAGKPSKTPISI